MKRFFETEKIHSRRPIFIKQDIETKPRKSQKFLSFSFFADNKTFFREKIFARINTNVPEQKILVYGKMLLTEK